MHPKMGKLHGEEGKTAELKICTDHKIVWDKDSMEIRSGEDKFDEAVEFEGKCTECGTVFLKTYLDPVYTVLKGEDREMVNAWDYQIAEQQFK